MRDRSREEMINSVLGQGSTVKGAMDIQGSVRIDGRVEGTLTCSESVVIGKAGTVKADIKAKTVMSGGKVYGNISAAKRVELQAGSCLEGDVYTASLVIADGVHFQGSCRMSSQADNMADHVAVPDVVHATSVGDPQ